MKIYAQNKKVRFDYEILETYEAGIKLKGYETKAAKKGLASLQGAFITTKNNKSYLTNAVIGFWQKANTPKDYNEKRQRELLLKDELLSLSSCFLLLQRLELALALVQRQSQQHDTVHHRSALHFRPLFQWEAVLQRRRQFGNQRIVEVLLHQLRRRG